MISFDYVEYDIYELCCLLGISDLIGHAFLPKVPQKHNLIDSLLKIEKIKRQYKYDELDSMKTERHDGGYYKQIDLYDVVIFGENSYKARHFSFVPHGQEPKRE